MKDTNRRIDLEVEELTRRITWESKPFYKRWAFTLKMWYRRNSPEVDLIVSMVVAIVALSALYYFLKYLTTVL